MAKRGWAPDYYWMEPLRELLAVTGYLHPKYLFWRSLIGGTQGQTLYYLPEFCLLDEPFAPDWTLENFVSFGPNAMLQMWAEKEVYNRYCEPSGGA